ncbi:MAG: ScyD/ScyE family protein [Bacteroidetes bacterium]|nr:ScyD/ScyE family protein [Bacteroidota bacterium]
MKKQLLLLATAMFMATFTLTAQVAPTVVAGNFFGGLIGVDVAADGGIWVTEYGSGNDDGVVTILDQAGNKTVFMTGLPSSLNPLTDEIAGPFRTYQMAGNKVLVVVGEGTHAQAEAFLVVDKTDFTPGTPLTLANVEQTIKIGDFVHAQGFLQSDPYNLAWDANGDMYIVDAGANSILKRNSTTGDLSIVKTLDGIPNPLPFGPPVADAVPTDIVAKPGGGFYVCNLTGFPFLEGAASVFNLDAAGNLSVYQSGFTCLTDMAFDPKDGNLCVMQFGVFGPVDTTLNFILGTAMVIKLLPGGDRDTIASGIGGLASSFTFDAAGDLYVTDLVFGVVLKYDFVSGAAERPVVAANVRTFPNPFTEKTVIEYDLQTPAAVSADIFDLQGRLVQHFDEGEKSAGTHSFTWGGQRGSGQLAEAGLYVWRLLANGQLVSGTVNLVR